jgi:hypothetical protein
LRFAAITLWVISQRVLIFVSIYFVIDSVRKLLDTSSYFSFTVTRLYNRRRFARFVHTRFSFIRSSRSLVSILNELPRLLVKLEQRFRKLLLLQIYNCQLQGVDVELHAVLIWH